MPTTVQTQLIIQEIYAMNQGDVGATAWSHG